MGRRVGRKEGRIVFGEYDGSTILVFPESFFSSSSFDIFSRCHNQTTYSAATAPKQSIASTREGRSEAYHQLGKAEPMTAVEPQKRSIASTREDAAAWRSVVRILHRFFSSFSSFIVLLLLYFAFVSISLQEDMALSYSAATVESYRIIQ